MYDINCFRMYSIGSFYEALLGAGFSASCIRFFGKDLEEIPLPEQDADGRPRTFVTKSRVLYIAAMKS